MASCVVRGPGGGSIRVALALLVALPACFVDPGTVTSQSSPSGSSGEPATTTAATTTTAPTTQGSDPTSTTAPLPSTTSDPTTTTAQPASDADDSATSSVFTTGDPDTTAGPISASTSPATTDPTCSPTGGACDGDADCCGCLNCLAGVCTQTGGSCPTCEDCKSDGTCEPDPGAACDDPTNDCGEIVYGVVNGVCHAAAAADGSCNENGDCIGVCNGQGPVLVECPECLRPDHNCEPGALVNVITIESVCQTSGQTPGCHPQCLDDVAVDIYECTGDGSCAYSFTSTCEPFKCSGSFCTLTCTFDSDCAPGYFCYDNFCG
jgi:hypothetical protein